jgi:hypothetical protein
MEKVKIKYLYLLSNDNTSERYIDCAEFEGVNINEDPYKSDAVLRKVFEYNGRENYNKQVLCVLTEDDSVEENIEKYSKLFNAKSLYRVTEEMEFVIPKKKIICLNNMNIYNSVYDVKKVKGVIGSSLYKELEKSIEEPVILGQDKNNIPLFWMYFDEFFKKEYLYRESQRKAYIKRMAESSNLGVSNGKNSKELYSKTQYSRGPRKVIRLNDLKLYKSVAEACRKTGTNVKITLYKGVHGIKTSGVDENGIAYQWMFYDEYLEKLENGEKIPFNPDLVPYEKNPSRESVARKIICLNNMEVYDSIAQASNEFDANIIIALRNGTFGPKTCGVDKDGNINQWMYYDEYLERVANGEGVSYDESLKPKKVRSAIKLLETGEVFDTIADAVKATGICRLSIKKSCDTGTSISKKHDKLDTYTWEYVKAV